MKLEYRINTARFDSPTKTYSEFQSEGDTEEECDARALKHFDKVASNPQNGYEKMHIVRIVTPAVAEKTKFLKDNSKMKSVSP